MKGLTEEDAIRDQRRVDLWSDETSGTINFKRLNTVMARNYLQACHFLKQSLGTKKVLKHKNGPSGRQGRLLCCLTEKNIWT